MRHVYHVFPAGAHWEITRGTGDQVVKAFAKRNDAIAWGMERGREHGTALLKVYHRDHTLSEEFTFGEEPAFFEQR